nr:PREDICTED: uncharacterized protein LOC104325119 isoform X2 [Haliaeetus albicilla]
MLLASCLDLGHRLLRRNAAECVCGSSDSICGKSGGENPHIRKTCALGAEACREASLETAAAALNRRDKLDALDRSRGGEEFYRDPDSGRYCKKCPAGTYVAGQCEEQNGSSKCLPCKEDEYIEYPNSFTKCLGGRTGREASLVQSLDTRPPARTRRMGLTAAL